MSPISQRAGLRKMLEYQHAQYKKNIENFAAGLVILGFDPEENDHLQSMRETLEDIAAELSQCVVEQVMADSVTEGGRPWSEGMAALL